MIKFFRTIRQSLLVENKFGKYLLYAIGEIALVVIGILIALSVSNWNDAKNLSKIELAQLSNLKDDINSDILMLKKADALYKQHEANSKIAIDLFYKAETIKDLNSIGSLSSGLWNELYINQNSYNEMVSSGTMHLIKNKELQRKITEYYLAAEANRLYLRDVNKVQSQMSELSTDIYPYKFLISLPKNHTVDLELIDTSWIGNPNSRTYLAVISYLNADLSLNNVYRRTVYQRTLVKADDLKKSLQEELKSRSN